MTIYYLMVKTHKITGLKYLCQTTQQNPHEYLGSGTYWKRHLKKHGTDISTEILRECQTRADLREWGLHYSSLWNVEKNVEWANIIPESGTGGCYSDEIRKRISASLTGKKASIETKMKMSNSQLGKHSTKRTPEVCSKMSALRTGMKIAPCSDSHKQKISEANKGKLLGKPWSVARRAAQENRKR